MVIELVGGPYDGKKKQTTRAVPALVFVKAANDSYEAPVSFYRVGGSNRQLYRLIGEFVPKGAKTKDARLVYLYAGHNTLRCTDCDGFHDKPKRSRKCTLCGGRLVGV